jgi:hypothetical protein
VILAVVWGSHNIWSESRLSDFESEQWTFGQVIAIVLLIVPMISLIEGYFRRKFIFISNDLCF